MWRNVFTYALVLALLFGMLKYLEYNYFVRLVPFELYVGLIALGFAALGVWAGRRIVRPEIIISPPEEAQINTCELERLGISKREYEVLELIAEGLSNREIAERLFVSDSTVKTHISNLFSKLEARRRTQAVQIAKDLRLIR